MDPTQHREIEVSEDLLNAIRSFPLQRIVVHCGVETTVSPFDFYATCPQCGSRIKVRSFSGIGEVEDIFDAVFEWMNQPHAQDEARRRQMALKEEIEPVAS